VDANNSSHFEVEKSSRAFIDRYFLRHCLQK
jgi:hypothetical protein